MIIDTWSTMWIIAIVAYAGLVIWNVAYAIRRANPVWIMLGVLQVGFLMLIIWLNYPLWSTSYDATSTQQPAATVEVPLCASLHTPGSTWISMGRIDHKDGELYVQCMRADGELTWVRVGGEEL
jgi:hypothetical protein